MLDNHIHQGNALRVDLHRIEWTRCVDMNDRQLRTITSGQGRAIDGVPREDHFCITVASEVMAALCLASSLADLKARLGRIVVAYNEEGVPVTAHDLHAEGAMTALLKDAIRPNLVQTLEGTPAIVHGGPFANIAHGCNSVIATKTALALGDYAITEAGFGADLGAEKFLDIKCRLAHLAPDAVVLVATVRALKMHGGADKAHLKEEDVPRLLKGVPQLERHWHNLTEVFGLPCVVAVNRFPTDTEAELAALCEAVAAFGGRVVVSNVWAEGGAGAEELAREVVRLTEVPHNFTFAYELEEGGIAHKIQTIATKIYGADGVRFGEGVEAQMAQLERLGYAHLPVCMAKTQYSFADDPTLLGAPTGFVVGVRRVKVSAGAGFVVAYTGDIMTMPGLPKVPAAEGIDVDDNGVISGLF